MPERHDEMVIYQSEDGLVKVDVLFENETVWLSQQQMAILFQKDISVESRHIKNIFAEGELEEKSNLHFLHFPYISGKAVGGGASGVSAGTGCGSKVVWERG